MNIVKSNIKFSINLYQNEGLPKLKTDIFPPHFLMTICGKPGSGKTTLLKFMLRSDKFFFKQFNYVYIISPSFCEYDCLFLPNENFCKSLNWKWIKDKIELVKKNTEYMNILFIFDDIISDLYNSRFSKEIMDFVFNRRHLLKDNGMISIILTSQKYTRIPTEIRSCSTVIILFKLNNMCLKKIFDDLIFEDKEKYDNVLTEIFGNDKQNFMIYRLCNNHFYKNFDKIIFNN
jgi:hypothetical protein